MTLKYFLIFTTIILASCNNTSNGQQGADKTEIAENGNGVGEIGGSGQTNGEPKGTGNWEKLEMRQFKDNKGNVLVEMPFPSGWETPAAVSGGPSITGPNGVKVTDFPFKSFTYVSDPQMQQIYYQSGQQLRPWPGLDEVVQQDIKQWGESRGLQFVSYKEYPEVAKVDQWYSDQLYKAVPTQTKTIAVGSDWKTSDGQPYFLLTHINIGNSDGMQNWYYFSAGLEAESAAFEKAKNQYLFSLANAHYALEPIMAYNENEAQKAGQSWAAFNKRMAQNQANFEATQRAHVNKSNAINESIMNNWRANNASSDKQQEQFINTINEQTKVSDASGNQYKVASHSNHYWMNNDGKYIGTDRQDYNPNLDENMNNQNWQELKKTDE
jgi:hypothetical protein